MLADLKLVRELRERTSIGMADCKKALEQSNNDIEIAIDLLKQWGELKGKEKSGKIAAEGRVWISVNHNLSVANIFEINCQTDFCARSKEFYELISKEFTSEEEFEKRRIELANKSGENIVLRRRETYIANPNCSLRWYKHPGDRLAVLLEVYSPSLSKDVLDFGDECAMQIAAMSPLVVSRENVPGEMLVRQRRIFEEQLREDKKPEAAWQKIIEGKFNKLYSDIVLYEQNSIKEPKRTINDIRNDLIKKLGFDVQITRFARYELGSGIEVKKENYGDEIAKMTGLNVETKTFEDGVSYCAPTGFFKN